jgi:phosphoglycolate phosphatase-like HAD superfamily hydrolase
MPNVASETPHRLVLWDVDGTLIRTGTLGRGAIERGAAIAASLAEVPRIVMSGKTDPQILREIFEAAELPAHRIEELLPAATRAAVDALAEVEHELAVQGRVLPGVRDVLEALDREPGIRQTLLTGNLVENAAVKVGAFDLTHFFDAETGAYGSDHHDRRELVPIARERSRQLRGEVYGDDEVWVIGDTANDLACARAGGVRCLLVGDDPELAELGADAHLVDLTDAPHVVGLLTA